MAWNLNFLTRDRVSQVANPAAPEMDRVPQGPSFIQIQQMRGNGGQNAPRFSRNIGASAPASGPGCCGEMQKAMNGAGNRY